jgi:hypothetical protein
VSYARTVRTAVGATAVPVVHESSYRKNCGSSLRLALASARPSPCCVPGLFLARQHATRVDRWPCHGAISRGRKQGIPELPVRYGGRMGAWGPGLFSDDRACDVRDEFRDLIGEGLTAEEATERILASYPSMAEDPDNGSVVLIALAVTQWKTGRLLDTIRDQAVAAIDAGADLDRWDDDPAKHRALAKAREQLLSPQRSPVRITRRRKSTTPFEAGDVLPYTQDSGRQVVFWVEQNWGDKGGTYTVMEAVSTDPQDAICDPGTVERARPLRRLRPGGFVAGFLVLDCDRIARTACGSWAGSKGRQVGPASLRWQCTPKRPGTAGKTRPLTASLTFISAPDPGYVTTAPSR